jgi:hypothetical protein
MRVIVGVVVAAGAMAASALPAQALPGNNGFVAFSGGPTTYPSVGSMSSTTCEADTNPCSVSLTTTSSSGGMGATGTGTVVEGTETINFQWFPATSDSSAPWSSSPGDDVIGWGSDQTGFAYELFGDLAASPTGGTTGQLVLIAGGEPAIGAIEEYEARGSSLDTQFSAQTTSCLSTQICSLSLSGTGSVSPTQANPLTYAATGTGQVSWGGTQFSFTFDLSTVLCTPDLSVFHEEDQTCGYLTGVSTGISGTPIQLEGPVTVGGFGDPTFYGFPHIRGSLVFTKLPRS